MYAPLDPKLVKSHEKEKRRLQDLERKYPKAAIADFQKSCMTWELLYGGKSLWVVDCHNRDVQKTMDSFHEFYGIFSGVDAGIATCTVTDKPNGPATGFQILCFERAKEEIKSQLSRMGILDSEMHWVPESELRRQFEEWKAQQSKQVKAENRAEQRKKRAQKPKSQPCRSGQSNLFELIVEESKAHQDFISMRNLAQYAGARQLMNELYAMMGDPNGNFVRDFQSYGYHARTFELACFGYLKSHGFVVDRSHPKPDFLVSAGDYRIAVEAATSSPSVGLNSDISLKGIDPKLPIEDLFDKSTNEFPIRMGNLIRKKLMKRYWLLPHCQSIPIVLFVSPLYEPGSIFNIDDSLARYLYGGWDVFADWIKYNGIFTHYVPIKSHTYDGRELKSNFFSQPFSEHISAVIYSNSFTETKFVRMAIQMGLESRFGAIKQGTCLLRNEDGEIIVQDFAYRLKDQFAPEETWFQGLTIFYNPKALFPLLENLFRSTNVYRIVNGNLMRLPSDFHPLLSFTVMYPINNES